MRIRFTLPAIAAFVTLFLAGSGAWAQSLSFQSRRDFPVGFAPEGPYSPNPDGIALADLNHDGQPDIVTANLAGSISVLLGAANGAFSAAVQYPTSPCQISTSVVLADFNGDGKLDAVVNDTFKGGRVCLLLGNGDGTFQAAQDIVVPSEVQWIAAADVNEDGKPDLILATTADLSILPGNGDGTFGTPSNLGVGPMTYVVTADFNGDGHADIAALDSNFDNPATMVTLLGAGDGTFRSASTFTFPHGASTLVAGSVTSRKKVDIVVSASPDLVLLLGNGDGTFESPVDLGVTYTYGLVIHDVNGDGMPDIVATGYNVSKNVNAPVVFVMIGKGDGTFRAPDEYEVDDGAAYLAVGDFNKDGRPDIVCTDENAGVTVLLNTGKGKFEHSSSFPAARHSDFVSVGDLNGDGLPDLIVTDLTPLKHRVAVLLNKGHGAFGPPVTIDVPATATSAVAIGDFNRDGKLDFAVNVDNSFGFSGVAVALGNGDGTFQPQVRYAVPMSADSVVAGDFNNDGKLDLAVANYTKSAAELSVLLGNGDGTFQTAVNSALPAEARIIVTGDFNGDGKLDIAGVSPQGGIAISLGNGDGTFQAAKTFQVGTRVSSMTAGDWNGDGILDLAVIDQPGEDPPGAQVLVALGNGDGTFRPFTSWFAGFSPNQVIAGDFNHDGKLDLAVSNSTFRTSNPADADVGVLLGNGDGTFQPVQLFGTAGQPRGMAAVDVEGNGHLDIVAGCDVTGVCVLLNTTP